MSNPPLQEAKADSSGATVNPSPQGGHGSVTIGHHGRPSLLNGRPFDNLRHSSADPILRRGGPSNAKLTGGDRCGCGFRDHPAGG